MHHVDGFVLRLSRGRATLAGITAGIPVLTITTTGARTGQRRTTPLLGVPFGSDIAIIPADLARIGTGSTWEPATRSDAGSARLRLDAKP